MTEHGDISLSASFVLQQHQQDNEKDVIDEADDNPDEHDFYRAWGRSLMLLHVQKYSQKQNKQQ